MIPIQKLRLKRGWTQQQLADVSGLSARTIQRIEKGYPPSLETLKCLASVFEIDYSTLNPEDSMEQTQNFKEREEKLVFRDVARIKTFYVSLLFFIAIVPAVNTINILLAPKSIWIGIVSVGLGLALVVQALIAFKLNNILGPDWERKEIEKRLGRPL